MDTIERRIKINGLIGGLMLGATLLSISIISYYFITGPTTSPLLLVIVPILFSFFLPIIIVLVFCYFLRKKIGGCWTFRQATTGIFIMFIIGYAVQVIGRDVIFAKFIEPDMVNKTKIAAIRTVKVLGEKRHASQTDINNDISKLQKELDSQKNISTGKVIQGMVFNVIFIFVFALIFSALFKREPSVGQSPL